MPLLIVLGCKSSGFLYDFVTTIACEQTRRRAGEGQRWREEQERRADRIELEKMRLNTLVQNSVRKTAQQVRLGRYYGEILDVSLRGSPRATIVVVDLIAFNASCVVHVFEIHSSLDLSPF